MRSNTSNRTPLCGTLLALAIFCGGAAAQTPLVTIQDTLFKADGTRFSGSVQIRWNTFDADNLGTVVQQSRTVQVTNGNFQVQLTPNSTAPAPSNVYTVQYQGDGREQFTETWTVAPNSQPVKIADVRTGMITSSGGTSAGNSTPIPEASIIGLVNDLGQRPVKGPGFGTGSVAFINSNGQVETVVGNIGDCVLVDGTTGPCGSSSAAFVDAETPGGLVDGTNLTFTLVNAPSGASLMLFRNGLYMKAGFDYTLSGSAIQFTQGFPPQPQDTLVASYRLDPDAGNIGAIHAGGSGSAQASGAQIVCSGAGHDTIVAASTSLGACSIPSSLMKAGDRFEVRFDYKHSGSASGFDIQVRWGATSVLTRHGAAADAAVSGRAEATLSSTGAQLSVESYGTVLSFLAALTSSPVQNGVVVDIRGQITTPGSDRLALTNYTVLRYPGN